MEPIRSDEDRFVYYVDEPDLQKLASYRVALSLWYSYISRSKCDEDPTNLRFSVNTVMCNFDNHRDLNQMVESLKMPQTLEKLLKKALTSVAKETSDWLGELRDIKVIMDTGVYDLNWCVWFDDGRIDHKRSALKVLSNNDELSNVQKFALMCKFCLEDEIMKFSLDSLPEDFISQAIFVNNRLIQYWYYRMKNELHKVRRFNRQRRPFPLTADMAIFASFSFQRWTAAFEYFWQLLETNQQIIVADIIILNNYFTADLLERLLGMLSWDQQCRVLSKYRIQMLRKFAREGDSLRVGRWVWTHCQDVITSETFVEFVGYLIEHRLNAEEWMSWLIELWDSTSDEYRIKAAERIEDKIFIAYVFHGSYSVFSFKILCRFLSLQSVDSRKKIILEHASQFGPHIVDHHSANEMLRLHLPNADDQQEFKKLVLESFCMKSVCVDLIVSANFDRLNMLLEFYLDPSNDVLLYKKELLESEQFAKKYVRYPTGHWNEVKEFIVEEMYPEDASLVLQMKKRLIESILFYYFHYELDDKCPPAQEVTELIQIVDSEFTKDDVIDLKHTSWCSVQLFVLANCPDSSWYETFFNERCFLRFVTWCVGDGDRVVLEFGNGVFVNIIFDGVFSALNKSYSHRIPRFNKLLLKDLEKYLSWYFASYRDMGMYKLRMVNSLHVGKIFRATVRRGDDSNMQILFNWFYQYNELALLVLRSNRHFRSYFNNGINDGYYLDDI